MTNILQAITIFFVTLLLGCNNQSGETTNNDKKDTAINNRKEALAGNPRNFIKNYGVSDNNRLFVFVGEKMSVKPLPHHAGSMDNGFKAKYKILKKVYGDFPEDIIEFIASDHYGTPAFSKFKNVLLYVSADSGMYYHQKYMYNDVYKTKDGHWAGTYTSDYEHAYNKHTKIKPVKIEFAGKVSFPTQMIDDDGRKFELTFPKPYFKTVGDSAIAIYGNYVEDLFALKKSGVLTSRGLFEATKQQEEDMVESMQPEQPKTPPTPDDLKFLAFWKTFVRSVSEPGLKTFTKIALDSLMICDNLISTGNFIDKCFSEVIDDEVRKRILDKTKLEYKSAEVEFANVFTSNARKEIVKVGDEYRIRQMLVTRSSRNNNPPTVRFDFIVTKRGYRLYAIDHHWFKECCR